MRRFSYIPSLVLIAEGGKLLKGRLVRELDLYRPDERLKRLLQAY